MESDAQFFFHTPVPIPISSVNDCYFESHSFQQKHQKLSLPLEMSNGKRPAPPTTKGANNVTTTTEKPTPPKRQTST